MKSIAQIKELLQSLGADPKRSLGQNFLISESHINKIIAAVNSFSPASLVEVGPGLGAITEELVKLEKDLKLIELDNKFYEYWSNKGLEVINKDALKVDWLRLSLPEGSCLVSNLPYQISSSIVIERSLGPDSISSMVLMFQKEVAQRIVAEEKTKAYGLLSVIAQNFWDVELVLEAAPGDFYPAPKVASRVLSFSRKKNDLDESYLKFVKAAFAQRRKFLSKNISSYVNPEEFHGIIEEMGHAKTVRAEELSPDEFMDLYKRVKDGH